MLRIRFKLFKYQNRSGLAVIVVVIVITMVAISAVIFAVPVALMNLPALPVVVVVGMAPIGAAVGWPLPSTWYPHVVSALHSPVAVGPDETFSRHWRPDLIPDRRGRRPNVDLDLAVRRNRNSRCGDD